MVFGRTGGRNSAVVSSADERAALPDHHKHGSPSKASRRMGDKMKHHTAVTTTEEEPGVSDNDRAAGTAVPVADRAHNDASNAGFQPPSSPKEEAPRRSFSSFRSFRSRGSAKLGGAGSTPSTPKTRQTQGSAPRTPVSGGAGGQNDPNATPKDQPGADGSTSGMASRNQPNLTADQVEAGKVAQNPQKYSKGADKSTKAQRKDKNEEGRKDSGRHSHGVRIANTETMFEDSKEQSEREQRVREYSQNEPEYAPSQSPMSEVVGSDNVGKSKSEKDQSGKDKSEKDDSAKKDSSGKDSSEKAASEAQTSHPASPQTSQQTSQQIPPHQQNADTVKNNGSPQDQTTKSDPNTRESQNSAASQFVAASPKTYTPSSAQAPSTHSNPQSNGLSEGQRLSDEKRSLDSSRAAPSSHTDHIRAYDLKEETNGFADAPDARRVATNVSTASQPSAQAVGSLSPRNRFIGHRSDSKMRNVDSSDGASFQDAPEGGAGSDIGAKPGLASTASFSRPHENNKASTVDGTANNAEAYDGKRVLSTSSKTPSTATAPEGPSQPAGASQQHGGTSGSAGATGATGASGTSTRNSSVEPARTARSDINVSRKNSVRGSTKNSSARGSIQESTQDDDDPDRENPVNRAESLNMPEGVPGLGFGDEDPLLPGEKRPKKKLQVTPDLETEKAKHRFATSEEEARKRRERQAQYAGWRQIGGWDMHVHDNTREESEDSSARSTMLETFVNDKYLGDWYQNTASIVATASAAWVLGRLRFSSSWSSIVSSFTATAYRTSVRRMRRNYRDDILRQQSLDHQEKDDTESMEWSNSFLIKFWLIYEPSSSQMITEIGNEVLEEQTPSFIHSMKLDKFTLGTKAPRIDFVRSFPRTNAQVVVIDMGVSFTPNDTMDLTARQSQTKVNPKVQLGVRVGKGFLTKNLPVLLEDMNFKGKFRSRMKLMERPPHIQTVDFSFSAPPDFDFVLKPIGGDKLGSDINIIPGSSKFIKDMVNANLGPMFYAPNAFQINVEQSSAGVGVLTGVGVLSSQIIRAEGLKKDADGRVDPYVTVQSKANRQLAHTKIKNNTTDPVWNETSHTIVTNTNDSILIEVFDFDESSPDRSIGQVPSRINDITGSEVEKAPITSGGRTQGYLTYVAHYAPVTMPSETDELDGNSPRDTKSGILSSKVTAARDLDPSISKTATSSPYVEIEFSGRLVDSTKVAKDTNNPEWNYSAEHIVLDKVSTSSTLRVRDNRSKLASPPQIAMFKSKLSQMLVESEKGRQWFSLGEDKGEIKVESQWKPANVTIGGSTNNYVEPIGVSRLNIRNAKNSRNLEHLGKIDPYTRAFLGNRLVARTDWFKNELNPVWNEISYIPVESESQSLTLEVMDVEKHGKDRSSGAFKIESQNIIKKDENDNYKVFVSDKAFVNKLMSPNRGPKGTLEYSVEFYPAIPIVGPEERDRINADKKLIERSRKKITDGGGDASKALSDKERHELTSREERLDIGGVDMPIEQQSQYKAGVFASAIVSLTGHRVGQSLRVIANNQPFPIYTSTPFKSSKRWTSDTCPDFVSGQMNLSSVRIELGSFHNKSSLAGLDDVGDNDEDDRQALKVATDPTAGETTIGCFELIRDASLEPKEYKMQNGAVLVLQARFFPSPGSLIDPSEDISNRGNIQIDLQKAVGVAAADRTGLSDPYCAFYLNNSTDRVYKSKTPKQTLNPVWNETFRFAVDDVQNGFVKAIVNDWDMGNADDFLGGYKFNFSELEPLKWKDYEVRLEYIKKNRETHKHKDVPGTSYLRMRFSPGELVKAGDHFLLGADSVTRAAGGMISAGGGLAAGAAAGGIGAVGTVAHAPQNLLHKITHHGGEENDEEDSNLTSFSASIDEITGLTDIKHDIQVRCYLLGQNERELYRSGSLKLERGETTPDAQFSFRASAGQELGVKVVTVKSLGRHSDVSQSSTELTPGSKEIRLTKDAVLRMTLAEE